MLCPATSRCSPPPRHTLTPTPPSGPLRSARTRALVERLSLAGAAHSGAAVARTLKTRGVASRLTELDLSRAAALTPAALAACVEALPPGALRGLNLRGASDAVLSANVLDPLLPRLFHLRHLDIGRNMGSDKGGAGITAMTLWDIGTHCRHLERLGLANHRGLNDGALSHFCICSPGPGQLAELDISGCDRVSSLENFSRFANLRCLDVRLCWRLELSRWQLGQLSMLDTLKLDGCTAVRGEELAAAASAGIPAPADGATNAWRPLALTELNICKLKHVARDVSSRRRRRCAAAAEPLPLLPLPPLTPLPPPRTS